MKSAVLQTSISVFLANSKINCIWRGQIKIAFKSKAQNRISYWNFNFIIDKSAVHTHHVESQIPNIVSTLKCNCICYIDLSLAGVARSPTQKLTLPCHKCCLHDNNLSRPRKLFWWFGILSANVLIWWAFATKNSQHTHTKWLWIDRVAQGHSIWFVLLFRFFLCPLFSTCFELYLSEWGDKCLVFICCTHDVYNRNSDVSHSTGIGRQSKNFVQ